MQITKLYTVFDIMNDEAAGVRSFGQSAAAIGLPSNWLVANNPEIVTAWDFPVPNPPHQNLSDKPPVTRPSVLSFRPDNAPWR